MCKIKTGIKMRVTPEQSKKVQNICIENGIGWGWCIEGEFVRYINEPYLFIDDIISFMYKGEEEDFLNAENEEISAELFIRTNGTCVESENTTEDNNKGEQTEELKLECLVEGYEGSYFEIGQVWETRGGERLKVKGFDFTTTSYKLTLRDAENPAEGRYYTSNGRYRREWESDLDLVRLVSTEISIESTPSEEPQPKTLSEYLKENNAYESFVENSVEWFLESEDNCKEFKENIPFIEIVNTFNWEDTKQDFEYWQDLYNNQPENLIYDMNEIIFAEVDKRIDEQKTSKGYMVFVEGKNTPRYIHDSYNSAKTEAKRLSTKLVGSKVFVVEIVKEYKSKVIVEEIE